MRLSPNLGTLATDSTTLIQSQNKPSASKLPVKRKTPDRDPTDQIDGRPPPFKFHRIWTEPDEIRFLQGLLDCSSQNLAFPRDLGIFYARFSDTMSQPYTKSQLSEKLRRLRKKFRVISTRLSKGLGRSQLSMHDRALYDLSKRLWHPDHAATSPFNGARNVCLSHSNTNNNISCAGDTNALNKSSLVGIKVDFSPTLPTVLSESDWNDAYLDLDFIDDENRGRPLFGDLGKVDNQNEEVRLSEVNVELEGEEEAEAEAMAMAMLVDDEPFGEEIGEGQNGHFRCGNEVGELAAKVAMNVFDECFEDVRRKVLCDNNGEGASGVSFEVRWQRQRIAEFDVLRSRLRLVLEHSLRKDC